MRSKPGRQNSVRLASILPVPRMKSRLIGASFRMSISKTAAAIIIAALSVALVNVSAQAQSQPVVTGAGVYALPQEVSMSASSGSIYYTTNGSNPTTASTPYTAPVIIAHSTQLKAVSYLSGRYSPITTAYVTVAAGDPLLWLNAEAGVTTNSGNPPPVASWADQSGNANNATHSTAGAPLLYHNSINSLASVGFAGSECLTLPSGFSNFSSGATVFVILKPSSLTADARIIDLGTGASGNNINLQISSSGSYVQFSVYNGTSGTSAQTGAALTAGNFQLLEAILTPGSPNAAATCYLNGTAGSTNSSMNNIPSLTRTDNFLGQASAAGNFLQGNIAELILYSRKLTEAERLATEAYLLQKYQIFLQAPISPVINLPSGTLSGPSQVTLSTDTNAATYITRDGSTPTSSSEPYDGGPITINYTQTIKAVSIKNGISSSVVSSSYTLDASQWPAPSPSDMTAPTINLELPVQTQ